MMQMTAPGSVLDKLAAAERAELQELSQERSATQMAREIVASRGTQPAVAADQVSTEALLDALARMVSERIVIQQRNQ